MERGVCFERVARTQVPLRGRVKLAQRVSVRFSGLGRVASIADRCLGRCAANDALMSFGALAVRGFRCRALTLARCRARE